MPDTADYRGQVNNQIGPRLVEQARDGWLFSQVKVVPARHEHFNPCESLEFPDHETPEKPRAAGNRYSFVREIIAQN